MIVYHADTLGQLREGQTLLLRHARTPIYHLYPNGVSSFGERVFLKPENDTQAAMQAIEIMFDYVRRLCYPDKPSRFESVFASVSLEDSKAWRKRISQDSDKDTDGLSVFDNTVYPSIFAVQSDKIYIADAHFLDCQNALPGGQLALSDVLPYARAYWDSVREIRTELSDSMRRSYAQPELLLECPVHVLHRIDP